MRLAGRHAVAAFAALLLGIVGNPTPAAAGSILLTGHDPDFHALLGSNAAGAININQVAIGFIMDPGFNPYSTLPFIFVESSIAAPGGHTQGVGGIVASGYVAGTDFVKVDAAGLNAALDELGTTYGGIVVASDFGGNLRQAELDILNARSADIIAFLNDGGGLYAMAESNNGAGLTPGGGHFGFLPFIVASSPADQSESGYTVTAFGASLGLTNADINGNFSHNVFTGTGGMTVVDVDSLGRPLSLATRSRVDQGGVVPEPAMLSLFGAGLALSALARKRRTAAARRSNE